MENATDLGFSMIAKFGMSEKLGPMEYGRRYEHLSSNTRAQVEAEVQQTLKKSYLDVQTLLRSKRKELDLLAKALVKYETLDREEVEKVIRGESLPSRTIVPSGPMIMPVPDNSATEPPGVPQPQPPSDSPPPPVAASVGTEG